jgi:hypothetical protein
MPNPTLKNEMPEGQDGQLQKMSGKFVPLCEIRGRFSI